MLITMSGQWICCQGGFYMVNWSAHEQEIIQQFTGKDYRTFLNEIPENERKWKCWTCKTILKNSELVEGKCPLCHETHLIQICPLDTVNGCEHTISNGIATCPICNQPICPICGSNHSVATISRVTGYLSNVEGWNAAKKAELRDRMRYNPLSMTQTT